MKIARHLAETLKKHIFSAVDVMAGNGQPLQIVFAFFVVLQVCEGERYYKAENCGEEANKHEEYSISQTVIEESLFMISPEDFYYNFLVKHRPFVMRRVARNWPAYTVGKQIFINFNQINQNDNDFNPKHGIIETWWQRNCQKNVTFKNHT